MCAVPHSDYLFDSSDYSQSNSVILSGDSDDDESFETPKPKGRKIPDPVKKLIGEASMCYVKKEYAQATECALEAIKIAPQIPDSYHTLGMIYSDLNDMKTAREYFMIAAHITRTDAELWKRLADMFKDDNDMEQYYYCLSKAVLHDSKNIDLLNERVEVGKQMMDSRGVLTTFQYLIALDGTATTATQIATALISENRKRDAAIVVKSAIQQRMKEKSSIDQSLANICMELLLDNNLLDSFFDFVKDYLEYCNTEINNLPMEMRTNITIAHLRNNDYEYATTIFNEFINIQDELYMDLAILFTTELMKIKMHAKSLELLNHIRSFPSQDVPLVWALSAVCYDAIGKKSIAIDLALKAHETVGYRGDITVLLMKHYCKIKNYQEAIGISEHYFSSIETNNNISMFDDEDEQTAVVDILRLRMKAYYALELYKESYDTFFWLFGKLFQKEELDLVRSRIKLYRFSKKRRWRVTAVLCLLGIEVEEEEKEKEKLKPVFDESITENNLFNTKRKRIKKEKSSQTSIVTIAPPTPNQNLVWETDVHTLDEVNSNTNQTILKSTVGNEKIYQTHEALNEKMEMVENTQDLNSKQTEQKLVHEKNNTNEMEMVNENDISGHEKQIEESILQPSIIEKKMELIEDINNSEYGKDEYTRMEEDEFVERETATQVERRTRNTDRDNKIIIEIASVFVLLEEVIGWEKIKKYIKNHMICAAEIDMMYECRITIDKFVLLFKLDEQMELSLRMSFINIAMAHSYYDEAISQTKAIGLIVPHRKDIWCYFNYMIILSRKHTNPVVLKYFSRMQQKYPNETIITIVLGNLFLTTCQFNKALQQYLSVYQSQKDSSLLNLQIALSFLGNVSNRNTVDKSNCFINALSFMEKYLKLCSYKKEALFNIARMYHQLEITHIAVHYYEQALSIIPNDANEALLDREIAYNMSLIYVKAENIELAIRIRQRYLMF